MPRATPRRCRMTAPAYIRGAYSPRVDVELEPDQPEAVVRVVAGLLGEGEHEPDPWWLAGVEDALGT